MWGMLGLMPDFVSEFDEDLGGEPPDRVRVGDIISIATRAKKPVFKASENFDDLAQLRVLGEAEGDRHLYLCLVTAGDAEHVNPTVVVGKKHAFDFGPEERFHVCEGVIVSDLHVRGIAKKQRGRSCGKCTEYNEDASHDEEAYLCRTCRENPWR